ncbi:MAG TPA: rhodanese-like domain-containing protein [Trueperaceae bacterium]
MTREAQQIDVQEARRRLESGVKMIDVREPREHSEWRIPGAELLPMSEFLERYEEELPKDEELMIQCRTGSRSDQVARLLLDKGYRAVNVAGGIVAWEGAGYPVERD